MNARNHALLLIFRVPEDGWAQACFVRSMTLLGCALGHFQVIMIMLIHQHGHA